MAKVSALAKAIAQCEADRTRIAMDSKHRIDALTAVIDRLREQQGKVPVKHRPRAAKAPDVPGSQD